MKSAKISVYIASLFLSLILFSYNFNADEHQLSKNKKSKTEAKLYPYEWAYLKKTWPYLNADPRATLDALEQAHKLHRETAEQRLNKGLDSVAWEFIGPLNVGGRVVDIEFDPSDPNIVYAGFATGGVFKSTDMGNNWFPIFDSLAVLTVGDIAIDPQNYPNPFNSTTKIRFLIPKRSFVQILVYVVLSRLKELLVNENINPSEYLVTLEGSNYPSGVYFYQMIANGKIIDTKKFIVAK